MDSLKNLNPPEEIWARGACPPGYEFVPTVPFQGLFLTSTSLILCRLIPPSPEASLPAPPPPGPDVCDAEYSEVFFQPDGSPIPENIRACQRITGKAGTVYVEGTFDSAARTFAVYCPADYLATGWGHAGKIQAFTGFSATDNLLVVASQPLPPEGWSVRLKSTSGGLTLARVWAVCLRMSE
jgi:hypothetical protein